MDYLKAACPDSQKPFDAVVVGEALIDVVTTPDSQVEHPGGSPANVAYGLGLLGVTTGLLTAIAPDERGRTIENHLHRAGVTLLPGSKSLTRTATATAALGPDGSAAYDFDIRWQLPTATPACFPKILHTGSIATFLNPGAGAVKTLLEQAHKHCTITYDPNIRPSLLGSHAEAKATFEAIGALTDVVKLSDEDAQWLYPAKTLEEAAEHILRLGAKLAVVTKGAAGSQFTSPSASITIPAVKATVADTIGAGDSYMAALILGLLTRGAGGFAPAVMEQLGRTAAAAAAITVQRAGANPPTLDELTAAVEAHASVPRAFACDQA
ncbi:MULTISPECIES: PfkB family carbohydrate kinase [unclassified Arthrobacter]|uniref:PfkB family carbohydrate kinase n=1 Tax=unclassified Arthrobacter TaxID=235627 RepID=UPI00036A107B|nr:MULTISPECIES: PfkB family carbohydrate kinase [unclassified Arthrobacter]BCW54383.1 fructokinase [Arthrobacter sp. StoSoilB19]